MKHAATKTPQGTKYAAHLRREFDVLFQATEGVGAASLMHALAAEAVIADTGKLRDSAGHEGYAWQPNVYSKRSPSDPVGARIAAAGSSLGRLLAGGHPTHRVYLAFLEALYQVTLTQGDDVTERIAALWDALDAAGVLEEAQAPPQRAPWYKRLWQRFICWWRESYEPPTDEEEEVA